MSKDDINIPSTINLNTTGTILPIKMIDTIPKEETGKKKKKKKKKKEKNMDDYCFVESCTKKLSFIDKQMTCKCKHDYCRLHRHISNHNCSADHISINKEYLTANNPIIIPPKLNMV
mgnify:FL=1